MNNSIKKMTPSVSTDQREIKINYLFFYGHQPNTPHGYLSQWYPCAFKDDEGHSFCSAEQFMMYQKAMLFKDAEIAKKVLRSKVQKTIKGLGRQVKGFDEKTWATKREEIVFNGNYYKFTQNKGLLRALLGIPIGTVFVEASPTDCIWGIGFSSAMALNNKNKWGLNLLGKALTQLHYRLHTMPTDEINQMLIIANDTPDV